jgi:hypothetical protein
MICLIASDDSLPLRRTVSHAFPLRIDINHLTYLNCSRSCNTKHRFQERWCVGRQYPNSLIPLLSYEIRKPSRPVRRFLVGPAQDLAVRRDMVYRESLSIHQLELDLHAFMIIEQARNYVLGQ